MILKGSHIQLELLNDAHKNELYEAAQNQVIWEFIPNKGFGNGFEKWYSYALTNLNNKTQLPFIARRMSDQKVIGSTRFYDMIQEHRRYTIGYTWYIPEVWGTSVNPESKYLLLKHAFEDLNANRIDFYTDVRNLRSRKAILKLGAKEEGVIRHHMLLGDGSSRNSMLFSIIPSEWPDIKRNLAHRINAS